MSGKIKILYIQAFAGGGSLIALYEMLKKIDPALIEPVVLCYVRNEHTRQLEQIEYCKVLYLPENKAESSNENMLPGKYNKISGFLVAQWGAIKKYFFTDKPLVSSIYTIIKEVQPAIVHHNNDIRANRADVRAALKAGVPSVLHIRTISFVNNHIVNYLFDRMLMRKVALRINITNAVSIHYHKLFPAGTGTSFVLHDFADSEKYYPLAEINGIKKEFGIPADCILLVNIGRITEWKGQHILIAAIHLIKDKLPCFKVLIVGSAEKGIGSANYELYLKALVKQYGLEDHFIFTGNRKDINQVINASTAVIHTSIQPEPQGLVVIEALFCKKKVIASDAGGTAELVKKYGGILVRPGDASALANAILHVTADNEHTIQVDAYPYDHQMLMNDFNGKNQVERLMNIYKQVLK